MCPGGRLETGNLSDPDVMTHVEGKLEDKLVYCSLPWLGTFDVLWDSLCCTINKRSHLFPILPFYIQEYVLVVHKYMQYMYTNTCIQIDTTDTTPFIFARYIYTIMKQYTPLVQRHSLALQIHHKKCWVLQGSNVFKAKVDQTGQRASFRCD